MKEVYHEGNTDCSTKQYIKLSYKSFVQPHAAELTEYNSLLNKKTTKDCFSKYSCYDNVPCTDSLLLPCWWLCWFQQRRQYGHQARLAAARSWWTHRGLLLTAALVPVGPVAMEGEEVAPPPPHPLPVTPDSPCCWTKPGSSSLVLLVYLHE